MFALLLALAAAPPPVPVFTRDIAPILYKHCAGCHHEGEVAPFPLLTYDDVKKHARQIADVTRTGTMPPWATVPGYGHFVGERRLSPSRDLNDSDLGSERRSRRRSGKAAASARLQRRLAPGSARHSNQSSRANGSSGRRTRYLRVLHRSHEPARRAVHSRSRVPAGQQTGGSSCASIRQYQPRRA